MNGKMIWFVDSISIIKWIIQQSNWTSIQQLNVDLVYEQNLPVLYSCLLRSIVFAFLFLPFTIAFFIAFNQNNSYNRQTANAKKLTKAEGRNPPITAHTLTTVWPSCYSDYWQQNGVHVTVCLGLNFRTRPHYGINKRNHFPINEFISSLATGPLDLHWL